MFPPKLLTQTLQQSDNCFKHYELICLHKNIVQISKVIFLGIFIKIVSYTKYNGLQKKIQIMKLLKLESYKIKQLQPK